MRLNPLHLRIALLALNLAAAVGVPAYAYLSFRATAENSGSLDLADPGDLVFREGETAAVMGRGPSQLIAVAGWVMPTRQVAEAPNAEDLTTDANTVPKPTTDSKQLEPGPLALPPHELEYVYSITRPENPLKNFVILRKKDAAAANPAAAPGAGTPSTRATTRRVTTPARPARVTVGRKQLGAGPPVEGISFVVADRNYKDQNVDFMIHSADEKEFVYWMPGEPGKMYALQKVTDSLYYTDKEKGLRPQEKSPEELALEEDKTKHFIFHETKDVVSATEKEYQDMLKGKPRGPILSPQKKNGSEKTAPGASSPAPEASGKAVPKFGRGKGASEPRTVMTEEEKQQLKDALKSPKMSQKDREELQKALMGAPGAK